MSISKGDQIGQTNSNFIILKIITIWANFMFCLVISFFTKNKFKKIFRKFRKKKIQIFAKKNLPDIVVFILILRISFSCCPTQTVKHKSCSILSPPSIPLEKNSEKYLKIYKIFVQKMIFPGLKTSHEMVLIFFCKISSVFLLKFSL